MPMSYVIDSTRATVRITCTGEVTVEDVLAYLQQIARDPARVGRFHSLVDLRDIVDTAETRQVRWFANELQALPSAIEFGVCAIVTRDSAVVGMAKLFSQLARDRYAAVKILPNIEEAEAWISSQAAG
jgi:hypothetical protein